MNTSEDKQWQSILQFLLEQDATRPIPEIAGRMTDSGDLSARLELLASGKLKKKTGEISQICEKIVANPEKLNELANMLQSADMLRKSRRKAKDLK